MEGICQSSLASGYNRPEPFFCLMNVIAILAQKFCLMAPASRRFRSSGPLRSRTWLDARRQSIRERWESPHDSIRGASLHGAECRSPFARRRATRYRQAAPVGGAIFVTSISNLTEVDDAIRGAFHTPRRLSLRCSSSPDQFASLIARLAWKPAVTPRLSESREGAGGPRSLALPARSCTAREKPCAPPRTGPFPRTRRCRRRR